MSWLWSKSSRTLKTFSCDSFHLFTNMDHISPVQSCDAIPLRQYDWTLHPTSAYRSLVLDLRMPLTNTGLNGANVLPLRISLFLVNGSVSSEYTLDWTSRMLNSSTFWGSNGFSSPFSLCSADFRQLSINRHTHAVIRTKDNPISSSLFVLTWYHFECLEGSNRHTSLTLAVLHLLQLFGNL